MKAPRFIANPVEYSCPFYLFIRARKDRKIHECPSPNRSNFPHEDRAVRPDWRPGGPPLPLRFLPQGVIGERDRHHRFGHGYESRQQARVVAALRRDRRWLAAARNGLLFSRKAARRLDGTPHDDGHS